MFCFDQHLSFECLSMGKKKVEELKVIEVEFRVSMHCNACERTVAKTISNFKGVEKFTTDMNKHKVAVVGRINTQKLLKKLKKKTGKRVEIVEKKKEVASKDVCNATTGFSQLPIAWPPFICDYCTEVDVLTMFSDENANACSIL